MHAMSAMPATSNTSDPLPHDEPARQALRLAGAALHALAQAESYLNSALCWETRALRLMAPDTTTPIDRQVLPGLDQMVDH